MQTTDTDIITEVNVKKGLSKVQKLILMIAIIVIVCFVFKKLK